MSNVSESFIAANALRQSREIKQNKESEEIKWFEEKNTRQKYEPYKWFEKSTFWCRTGMCNHFIVRTSSLNRFKVMHMMMLMILLKNVHMHVRMHARFLDAHT